jgi:putative hydrolase of the HAD superfamily
MTMIKNKVWIFDLDDTLHDASAHIFPEMHQLMVKYIMDELGLSSENSEKLRVHYWQMYGATLKGLVLHHNIDAHHFLKETHTFPDLHNMVVQSQRLRAILKNLPGRKCIFTNGQRDYALAVLEIMGIADCFELVFSVESVKFHAKPSVRGFKMLLRSLKVSPTDCIMVEDSLPALMTARKLGMRTIWITKKLQKPNFVDYRLSEVLALTHLKL